MGLLGPAPPAAIQQPNSTLMVSDALLVLPSLWDAPAVNSNKVILSVYLAIHPQDMSCLVQLAVILMRNLTPISREVALPVLPKSRDVFLVIISPILFHVHLVMMKGAMKYQVVGAAGVARMNFLMMKAVVRPALP